MRKIYFLFVPFLLLVTLGCHGAIKKEVQTFINDKEELILQIGKIVEENPTNAGVEEARKVFQAKKGPLEQRRADIFKKNIPFSLTQMMLDSNVTDGTMFNMINSKLTDGEAIVNFSKLTNEFNSSFHK